MKTGGNTASAPDWPADLQAPVSSLPEHEKLRVALSGGLDSVLLLHVAVACHAEVTAIHVNHQLQPDHEQTEQFCRDVCARLSLPIVVERVKVPVAPGGAGGIEESARQARYQVFRRYTGPGDLLLMAHHGDDQLETVLFRLLRGSGVNGLAGMPQTRPLGQGHLLRPWLTVSRARLEQVAKMMALRWREDPSNDDQIHDRNYLRHAVLPGLKQRWPGLLQRVAHSARACADSEHLNRRLAELQWQQCGDDDNRLRLDDFEALSRLEQRNLLRWWIHRQGWPLPVLADWHQALSELLTAGKDRAPEIRGEGFSVRRYRRRLYLVPAFESPKKSTALKPEQPVRWGVWRLALTPAPAFANPNPAPPPIRVSTRQGGERVAPEPGRPSRALKTWLQEQGVPPWERAGLPLVYELSQEREVLIAVGNLWCSDRYSGSAPVAGWRLIVERDCD